MVLCTSSDKGPYMSGVWWLNVVRFRRFAFPIACPEKKRIIIITRKLHLQANVTKKANVIMLNLGSERLTPKVLNHYLQYDLGMQQLL